jgi:hypothetical protein
MLIDADQSCLVVVDVQQRLAPAIAGCEEGVANCKLLLRAGARLGLPTLFSEQYPKGLGPTVAALAPWAKGGTRIEKLAFSCMGEKAFVERLNALKRRQVVVCGMEAHVCVLQTAMEIRQAGFDCFVVADATGSRRKDSKVLALDRLARHGVEIVTAEMVVFEWLGRAGSEVFREVSALLK